MAYSQGERVRRKSGLWFYRTMIFVMVFTSYPVWGQSIPRASAPTPVPVANTTTGTMQNAAGSQNKSNVIYTMIGGAAVALGAETIITGQGFISSGPWGYAEGVAMVAAGVLIVAAGNKDNSSGGALNNSANNITTNCGAVGTNCNPTASPPPGGGAANSPPGSGNLPYQLPPNVTKSLAGDGITVDPRTGLIKLADGSTLDPNALKAAAANPSSITDPGMQAMASGFNNAMAQVKKDMADQIAAANKDGSAGSKDATVTVADATAKAAAAAAKVAALAKKSTAAPRGPAATGLKTLYNGEYIGVAADDIFGLINRRYDARTKLGNFDN